MTSVLFQITTAILVRHAAETYIRVMGGISENQVSKGEGIFS